MGLPFAEFMAGEISQAIIGSVLVHFRESRIVENKIDEDGDREVGFERHHSQMNEFGGVVADDLHTQQTTIRLRENQFQKTGGIADDFSADIVGIASAAPFVFDFLLFAGFFGFPYG